MLYYPVLYVGLSNTVVGEDCVLLSIMHGMLKVLIL